MTSTRPGDLPGVASNLQTSVGGLVVSSNPLTAFISLEKDNFSNGLDLTQKFDTKGHFVFLHEASVFGAKIQISFAS